VLDDPLRQLDNDALNTSELMRDTNIKLIRKDTSHNTHKARGIIARHAIKHVSAVLKPAFVYVR
jgi:hypothetical protein